jgi:hypothetical protein
VSVNSSVAPFVTELQEISPAHVHRIRQSS